jgi:hypothetical protein
MNDDRVPIKMPDNLEETVAGWLESCDGSVGVCLRCGDRIMSADDLIRGTNRHRCQVLSPDRSLVG